MKFHLLYACSTSCLSVSAENIMWATYLTYKKLQTYFWGEKITFIHTNLPKIMFEFFVCLFTNRIKIISSFFLLLDFIPSFERKNWLLTTTFYIWIYFVPYKKTDFQKYYKRLEFNFFSTKSTYSTFWLIEYGSQIKLNRHLYKRCIFKYFTGMHLKNWVDQKNEAHTSLQVFYHS